MVSWAGDGLMSGFNPTSHKLTTGQYHFAVPGTVDVQAITRLQYTLDSSWSSKTYPNTLNFSAPITFTHTDLVNNTGKWLTVSAFVVADSFVTGTPTPKQILANPNTIVFRAGVGVLGGNVLGITKTFDIAVPPSTLGAGYKLWVLLLPVVLTSQHASVSVANDQPIPGTNPNTLGRALSFWTNRTPRKPTITYPSNGAVFNPGAKINLTYTTDDPDAVTPIDTNKSNLDLNGVQFQIAPQPTAENPNPAWIDYEWAMGGASSDIVKNLGVTITAGGHGDPFSRTLAGGDWQIRMRVADWGHPYPNLVAPFGSKASVNWSFNNAPASNISPWSDPVRLSIPMQTPPPVPTSPINSTAVAENTTVRLSWKYRNTAAPTATPPGPYAQAKRWVQIRPVGSTDWQTIFAGLGSAPYVDLPPVLDSPPPVLSTQYLSNGTFEGGTVEGWHTVDPGGIGVSPTGSVANSTVRAHSGTRSLAAQTQGTFFGTPVGPYVEQRFSISAGHDQFDFNGWFFPDQHPVTANPADPWVASFDVNMAFYDVSGNPVAPNSHDVTDVTTIQPSGGWTNQWINVALSARVPSGAVTVAIQFSTATESALAPNLWADDLSLVGSCSTNTDDFVLEATSHYEWRVLAEDSQGVQSTYSSPASFWVVPAPATGSQRPVPSETIEGATLGCGNNRVFVYRRGAQTRVAEITGMTHVDWGRKRDDISTAQVVINDWDIDCGNLLAQLQPWAYEMVIFRENGFTTDRVWEGPIVTLTYERDKVTIQSRDVMCYAYRRIMKQQINDAAEGNTVTARAAQVLQNAFAPDDPNVLAYMQVITRDDDARERRSTPAYSRTAFEEVDDMAANAGLDYTVVGRSILLWGTKNSIGRLPELRDEDLGSTPIVSVYGMSMANRYVVSDGNGIWGEATRLDADGNDTTYGLVEMLSSTWATDSTADTGTFTQSSIAATVESFEQFAEQSISTRYPPPVIVRIPDNTSLSPDATLSINQLVPGVIIPLRSNGTLKAVGALQKLDSVSVTQEAGKETITITLSPFGGDDALAQEESSG